MAYNCIKNGTECDGCEQCKIPLPKCPCCGEECDSFYVDGNKKVLGCESCVERVDSYEND